MQLLRNIISKLSYCLEFNLSHPLHVLNLFIIYICICIYVMLLNFVMLMFELFVE